MLYVWDILLVGWDQLPRLCPLPASCPPPASSLRGKSSSEGTETGLMLRKHCSARPKHPRVSNAAFVTSLKHSTTQAAVKEISSIPARPGTGNQHKPRMSQTRDVMLTGSQCMEIQTSATKDVREMQSDTNTSDNRDRGEK